MIVRRRPICRVSMSGFWPSETKPDNRLLSVINNLPPNCRVCRVFLGVETRRETVVFARIWWLPAILLIRLDLHDARQ
jgi:hypothetical protein